MELKMNFDESVLNVTKSEMTPEQAFQYVMAKMGQGITDILAQALVDIKSKAAEKDSIGWTSYLNGAVIDFEFGSPIECTPKKIFRSSVKTSSKSDKSCSITIGVTIGL